MAQESTIRVQALDGKWETLGIDRYTGIFPEQIRPVADQLGPASLSFSIQRDTGLLHPDLSMWTPCEVEIGGITVWDGRIKETPTTEDGSTNAVTVNGLGWQSHLDDDAEERLYVHQQLTAWQDTRGSTLVNLNQWVSAPQVTTATGSIALGLPAGTPIAAGSGVGVMLDLGLTAVPVAAIVDAIFTGTNIAEATHVAYYIRAHSTPDALTAAGISGNSTDAPGSGTLLSTLGIAKHSNLGGFLSPAPGGRGGPWRYVTIFLFANAAITPSADISMSISRILVGCNDQAWITDAAGTSDGALGQSDLRASDIFLDAIARTCPLLTASPQSPAYADEVLADGPTSYWRLGNNITPPGGDRILTSHLVWTADLGSANNPIASLAGTGTSLTGGLLLDDDDQALAFTGSGYATIANPTDYASASVTLEQIIRPSNPAAGAQEIQRYENHCGCRINASGRLEFDATMGGGTSASWAANGLTLTAGQTYHVIFMYDGTSACYLVVNGQPITLTKTGTGINALNGATTAANIAATSAGGELFQGTIDEVSIFPYVLSANQQAHHYEAALARVHGTVTRSQFKIPDYVPANSTTAHEKIDAVNALHNWRTQVRVGRRAYFQPQPSMPRFRLADSVPFTDAGANDGTVVYNKVIVEGQDATGQPVRVTITAASLGLTPTPVDRRGFLRTKVLSASSAIDTSTATQLARIFLEAEATSPFRGSFIAAKTGDVLLLPGDTPLHPSELLLWTQEIIIIPRIDPDTGAIGRDGKIVNVSYDDETEQANVTVDDDRTTFEALMARMAVLNTAFGG